MEQAPKNNESEELIKKAVAEHFDKSSEAEDEAAKAIEKEIAEKKRAKEDEIISKYVAEFDKEAIKAAEKFQKEKEAREKELESRVKEYCAKFYEADHEGDLQASIDVPEDIQQLVILRFLHQGDADVLVRYINGATVKTLFANMLVSQTIERGEMYTVLSALSKFTQLDPWYQRTIAEKLAVTDPELLMENMGKFPNLNQVSIAEMLLSARGYHALAQNIRLFDPANHQKIAELMLRRREHTNVFIQYVDNFQQLDKDKIAEMLIITNRADALMGALDLFVNADRKKILDLLLQKRLWWYIAAHFDFFRSASSQEEFITQIRKAGPAAIQLIIGYLRNFTGLDKEFAKEIMRAQLSGGYYIAGTLNSFSGLDEEIAKMLILDGWGPVVYSKRSHFIGISEDRFKELIIDAFLKHNRGNSREIIQSVPGIDLEDFAEKILRSQHPEAVIEAFDLFPSLAGKEEEIAIRIINLGHAKVVARFLDHMEGLGERLAEKLVESSPEELNNIIAHLKSFSGLGKDREAGKRILEAAMKSDQLPFHNFIKFNAIYKPPLDRLIEKTSEMFGEFAGVSHYALFRNLNEGKIPEEAKTIGVNKAGEVGMLQLSQKAEAAKKEFIKEGFNVDQIEESPFFSAVFKKMVRLEESQFAEVDSEEFWNIIESFKTNKANGSIRPLEKSYESAEMRIAKVSPEEQDEFHYSESFMNRYRVLLESLKNAEHQSSDERSLSKVIGKITEKLPVLINGLENSLQKAPNPTAKEILGKRIAQLKTINPRNIRNFQKNFSALADFRELQEELRDAVFNYAIRKNRIFREKDFCRYDVQNPKVDEVNAVLSFIDQIVNQQTFRKYFSDERAAKKFRELLNVRALEEEMAKAQDQSKKGGAPFKFMPTRGILAEFSGEIGDACWAGEYNSVLNQFPNITHVIMIQNPGMKTERLAGASLLIEANAADGSPLLIIRGLNPQENIINKLKVEEFYKEYTAFARKIAGNLGRKLAVVVDDHSGGAGSNRPVLWRYLRGVVLPGKEQVKLAATPNTNFNGYNIENDCYYI